MSRIVRTRRERRLVESASNTQTRTLVSSEMDLLHVSPFLYAQGLRPSMSFQCNRMHCGVQGAPHFAGTLSVASPQSIPPGEAWRQLLVSRGVGLLESVDLSAG